MSIVRAPPARGERRRGKQPKVAIFGVGRVGGALAVGLVRAGWDVFVVARSRDSRRRASALGLPVAEPGALGAASICILAVPDPAVSSVARELDERLPPRVALVHCAGGLTLTALSRGAKTKARPLGSFHPLCAVSDPRDDLTGQAVALSATHAKLGALLWRMASALRLTPLAVPESGRGAYHAGAVLAAGGLVALASSAASAWARAGIGERKATDALVSLMRSAIRGIERRGLREALTGPIARGDWQMVERHLKQLPREAREVYLSLAEQALRLAAGSVSKRERRLVSEVLRRWRKR